MKQILKTSPRPFVILGRTVNDSLKDADSTLEAQVEVQTFKLTCAGSAGFHAAAPILKLKLAAMIR